MLTEKQGDAYKRDGYLKAEGLFTLEEVKELNSEMHLIIEDEWGAESIGYHASEMKPVGLDAKEPNNKTVVSGSKKRGQEPRLTYR